METLIPNTQPSIQIHRILRSAAAKWGPDNAVVGQAEVIQGILALESQENLVQMWEGNEAKGRYFGIR